MSKARFRSAGRRGARIPKLCKRRSPSSGQVLAYAKFDGKTVSFGRYDEGAVQRYQEHVAHWLARGCRPRENSPRSYTVCDLVADFLDHADVYYRHAADGSPTSSVRSYCQAARPLLEHFGQLQARDFDLGGLKLYRQTLIDKGNARKTVNGKVQAVRRMFAWAAGEELLLAEVPMRLGVLKHLRRGRTPAPDRPSREPVEWSRVRKTLPHLTPTLRGLLLCIWWTGMRLGEAAQLRTRDVDMAGAVWVFRPPKHKTLHHGKEREIDLGKRAQEAVQPFVQLDPDRFWFRPSDSAAEDRAKRRANRKTPLWNSHLRRYARERKKKPKRSPRDSFDSHAVCHALRRACRRANVEPWTAHQLRHAALTRIRKEFGLEAALAIGGHGSFPVTEGYTTTARRELAREVARRIG